MGERRSLWSPELLESNGRHSRWGSGKYQYWTSTIPSGTSSNPAWYLKFVLPLNYEVVSFLIIHTRQTRSLNYIWPLANIALKVYKFAISTPETKRNTSPEKLRTKPSWPPLSAAKKPHIQNNNQTNRQTSSFTSSTVNPDHIFLLCRSISPRRSPQPPEASNQQQEPLTPQKHTSGNGSPLNPHKPNPNILSSRPRSTFNKSHDHIIFIKRPTQSKRRESKTRCHHRRRRWGLHKPLHPSYPTHLTINRRNNTSPRTHEFAREIPPASSWCEGSAREGDLVGWGGG